MIMIDGYTRYAGFVSVLYLICIIKMLELCVTRAAATQPGQRPLEVAVLTRVVRRREARAISGHNLSGKHIRYSRWRLKQPDLNSSNRVANLHLIRVHCSCQVCWRLTSGTWRMYFQSVCVCRKAFYCFTTFAKETASNCCKRCHIR